MTSGLTLAPRQVFCVLDAACRDLAVADDVRQGRYTIAGRTLSLGLAPDWRGNPWTDDKEWRIEWVKFYYGLDLAHACARTGDRRYQQAWSTLVTNFASTVPVGFDDSEVTARRIQNWIYAWNRFDSEAACEPFAADAAEIVRRYIWDEVRHVQANLTRERNHRTLELYALLIAALAFPDLDSGHRLREFAFEQLHQNLLADMHEDGVHRECSTHYHCIVLRSFLGAMQNMQQHGQAIPASYIERVERASEFALHCHRPDGRIPACSDADSERYADVLRLAGRLLGRPDFEWAASGGLDGAPPSERFGTFAVGGYYTQRSGWGTDRRYEEERFLIFDCGPLGDGGHGHYDALSVEIASGGQPLLIDPGRYTYAETPPNWRRWFKSTAAHNTVLVDGCDQTPYSRRKPTGAVASSRLVALSSAPRLDMLVGECTSPSYDAVHTRAVIFVADEYWLVADYLAGAQPHTYELRWHLSAVAGQGLAIRHDVPGVVASESVTLAFVPPGPLRLEQGWESPAYGIKHQAPVVVLGAAGDTAVLLTAIASRDVAPGPDGVRVTVLASPRTHEDQFVVEVHGVGASGTCLDTVMWSSQPHAVVLPALRGVARSAWWRRDAAGELVAYAASDVTELAWTEDGAVATRAGAALNTSSIGWSRESPEPIVSQRRERS